jgi:RNA polymerase sigma-70 factor (ECF subfamily)
MATSPEDSFQELMVRLRAGDPEAAARVFHRYVHGLVALARSRLDRRLRQKVDPEDILQSVFLTFFRRQANQEFDLGGWDNLWALLTVITLRKCGHQIERFRAGRRDSQREVHLPLSTEDFKRGGARLAAEPTPTEAAVLTETVEQVLAGLKPRQRPILVLSLQGYTVAEISAQIRRSERTVHRVLSQVREQLERLQDASQAG